MFKTLFILIVSFLSVTTFAEPKAKAFNPDISANFLGLLQEGMHGSNGVLSEDRTAVPHNGLSLQEAEVQFTSDVDPYFRASVLLSVAQKAGSTEFGIDPEEVFLETISLPSVTLRAGKFKAALGKHNMLHTHAYPFIDAPLINQVLLGDEGLNEAGFSAAVLLPSPWFSEFTVQLVTNSNDTLYNSPSSKDMAGVGRLKNLFDLTDDLTMEMGVSGTAGRNMFSKTSSVVAGDLTFKWRPAVGGKYHALFWSTEYLLGDRLGFATERVGGLATWVQYQMAERWWVQARYEHVGFSRSSIATPLQDKESFLIGFFPSEFSGLRLQYDHLKAENRGSDDHVIGFQYNVSIGAHPAHAY